MYCWNCGHKNPDDNKFCGECGKAQSRPPALVEDDIDKDTVRTMNPSTNPLRTEQSEDKVAVKAIPAPPPGSGITPTVRATAANPLVGERAIKESPLQQTETAVPPSRPAPSIPTRIAGPSFLGLSDGPASSDYLFEEEYPERSSTARSYIMLALVLIAGVLVYKQWDTVSTLGRQLLHRATAVAPSTIEPKNSEPPAAPEQTSSNEVAANKPVEKPESDHSADKTDAAGNPEATEEDAIKKETAPPETKEPAKSAAKAESESKKESKSKGAAKGEETAAPVYDDSAVEQAQKYLQGRGVAQNCNRGLTLLRSAAAQPNPKAQIKLGALYATGHCVEQDRAEAYRWFAQAHELQPSNQWIDKNLSTLWAEMTSAERKRAQR